MQAYPDSAAFLAAAASSFDAIFVTLCFDADAEYAEWLNLGLAADSRMGIRSDAIPMDVQRCSIWLQARSVRRMLADVHN